MRSKKSTSRRTIISGGCAIKTKTADPVRMDEVFRKSDNLVFVDGITRSGKFWLGAMLMHFKGIEHTRQLTVIESLVNMNLMGVVDENAATSLLQDGARIQVYETVIGRNINTRYPDSTCIYKNPNGREYLKRTRKEFSDRSEIREEMHRKGRLFPFVVHDWLCNIALCFEAFPDMRLLRIERNPVDLVYAWHKKGYGRMENIETFTIRVEGSRGPVPWHAYRWITEYEKMPDMDRNIRSIAELSRMAARAYSKLPYGRKKRILFTSYERMGTQSRDQVAKIGGFLKARPSATMKAFLARDVYRQRTTDAIRESRAGKLIAIKKLASPKMFNLLLELDAQYGSSGLDVR